MLDTLAPDADARNVVQRDRARHPDTFALRLGTRCDLIAETHDGDTTTLTIRRKPRVLLDEAAA